MSFAVAFSKESLYLQALSLTQHNRLRNYSHSFKMQFKFVLLAFLGSAVAQKEVFLQQLELVHHALDSLDAGVVGLAPGVDTAAAATALTSKSGQVLSAINNAIAAIGGASALDLVGSSALVGPSDHLVSETEKTISDLIAKKDIIAGAKQTGNVLSQLKSQAAGAAKLADAISAKVPDSAKSIASSSGSKIAAAINKGIAAFS
jgi:hypothetical protein